MILAICRDKDAYYSVFANDGLKGHEIVVASDDLEVQEIAKTSTAHRVIYLDQVESFFNVAPEVLVILHNVNTWLSGISYGSLLPAHLLYWTHHVEGGDTTQRIQDAVLEIRSIAGIVEREKPVHIVIGRSKTVYWEDKIIVGYARANGITVSLKNGFSLQRTGNLLKLVFLPVLKEGYRSLRTINVLFRRKKSQLAQPGKFVAIQLCSDVQKHLNHTLPLLRAFEKRGQKAVAVTYEIGNEAERLREENYTVAELEAFLSLQALLKSWIGVLVGCTRSWLRKDSFLANGDGNKYQPYLKNVLWPSVYSFLIQEFPNRYRLDAASNVFFKRYPPVAARFWTDILPQGVIAYQSAVKQDVHPVTFWHPTWPYNVPEPYHENLVPIQYYFCISPAHRDKLFKENGEKAKYTVSGIVWQSLLKEFRNAYSKSFSRTELGIAEQAGKRIIILDAMAVLRGYCSSLEQSLIVNALVELAEENENLFVLIKPHAQHKPGQLEKIFQGRGNGRIKWIAGDVTPYHGINAADIVLTKYSTLAAEAMILDVPSICVLLDNEERWKIYDDAVDYAYSIEELKTRLKRLLNDDYFQEWQKDLNTRMDTYKSYHLSDAYTDRNEIIADTMTEAINKI